MKRMLIVVTLPLMLGGCVLPLQAKLAMWALDGISYLATKKSVTDHGISAVTGRDCAMLRILSDDPICSQDGYKPVLVARVDSGDPQDLIYNYTAVEHLAGIMPDRIAVTQPIDVASVFPSGLGLPEAREPTAGADTQIAGVEITALSESRDPWTMGEFQSQ